jgi:hypothetical protein
MLDLAIAHANVPHFVNADACRHYHPAEVEQFLSTFLRALVSRRMIFYFPNITAMPSANYSLKRACAKSSDTNGAEPLEPTHRDA